MQIVNSKQIHANPRRFFIVGMCRKGDTSSLAKRSLVKAQGDRENVRVRVTGEQGVVLTHAHGTSAILFSPRQFVLTDH